MSAFVVVAALLGVAALALLFAPAPALAPAERPGRGLMLAVAAGVLGIAAAGYAWVGSPRLVAVNPASLRVGASGPDTQAALDAIADTLHAQALAHPQDALAWFKWARSELDRGRPQAAAVGYRQAIELRPRDPDLLADGADVLALASGGRLDGEPLALVERALAVDPDHVKALALKGTEAAMRHDFTTALAAWDHALKVAPPGDPIADFLARQVSAVRAVDGAAARPGPAPSASASASASASTSS